MGPKDRGPGKAAGQASIPGASLADNLYRLGVQSHQAGQVSTAEDYFSQAAAVDPRHVPSLYGLGLIALQTGRNVLAASMLEKAIALHGGVADWHYNLGIAYQNEGRAGEAMTHFERAAVLDPSNIDTRVYIANLHAAAGELARAEEIYRSIIAARPDQLDVRENLAGVLLTRGRAVEAAVILQDAFRSGETPGMKSMFIQCARQLGAAGRGQQFRHLVLRALTETWGRPADLAEVGTGLIKANPAIAACIDRAGDAWPRRAAGDLFGPSDLAALDGDALLLRLLESTFVTDIGLEKFLTNARSALLEGALGKDPAETGRAFFAALARQCFINEYVFDATADEWQRARDLRSEIEAAVQAGHPVADRSVIAVAAYLPLHEMQNAAALLERNWSGPVAALLVQQVDEPRQEMALRASMPRVTPIDAASVAVQAQYSENPYPRWIKLQPATPRASLDQHIRVNCPRAQFRPLGKGAHFDMLMAGCGTGQWAAEAGQRFPAAKILAIDISLSSLGYAARKAREAGIGNIEFAQGDILKVGEIGRSFDVIESSGVLHHLVEPLAGWRALLGVLRPNGFMEIGLYSEAARRHVVAGRDYIAERGYQGTPDDIRRFRQDIVAMPADAPLKTLVAGDFFTLSACRDLLFHVQERRFSLPEIKDFLDRERLRFLGFNLPDGMIDRYSARFPQDKSLTDLDLWHEFETDNPYTFRGMYQFWVQREG